MVVHSVSSVASQHEGWQFDSQQRPCTPVQAVPRLLPTDLWRQEPAPCGSEQEQTGVANGWGMKRDN